jgi:hypothetical protein
MAVAIVVDVTTGGCFGLCTELDGILRLAGCRLYRSRLSLRNGGGMNDSGGRDWTDHEITSEVLSAVRGKTRAEFCRTGELIVIVKIMNHPFSGRICIDSR